MALMVTESGVLVTVGVFVLVGIAVFVGVLVGTGQPSNVKVNCVPLVSVPGEPGHW